MRAALLALLFLASPAAAKTDFPSEGEAGCGSPVGPADTAKSLKERFGPAYKIEKVAGVEGMDMKAVVLFGDDPARRLEVIFYDDKLTQVSGYRLPSENSKWRAAGLAPGADVKAVEAANGGPYDISGFDWDYGGYVVDLRGGKLAKLPGGCTLSIRFAPQGETPAGLSGDGVKIASNDKRLAKAAAKASEIMVSFPARQ